MNQKNKLQLKDGTELEIRDEERGAEVETVLGKRKSQSYSLAQRLETASNENDEQRILFEQLVQECLEFEKYFDDLLRTLKERLTLPVVLAIVGGVGLPASFYLLNSTNEAAEDIVEALYGISAFLVILVSTFSLSMGVTIGISEIFSKNIRRGDRSFLDEFKSYRYSRQQKAEDIVQYVQMIGVPKGKKISVRKIKRATLKVHRHQQQAEEKERLLRLQSEADYQKKQDLVAKAKQNYRQRHR